MLKKLIIAGLLLAATGCSLQASSSNSKHTPFNEQFYVESLVKNNITVDTSLESVQFLYGKYDLNGNGNNEYIIQLIGPYFCGSGGCSTYLFDNQNNQLDYFTVASTPIAVSEVVSHGWHDLIIWSNRAYRKIEHTGKHYPSNPSVEPETTLENSVIIIDTTTSVQELTL